jgi:hypothetical protein
VPVYIDRHVDVDSGQCSLHNQSNNENRYRRLRSLGNLSIMGELVASDSAWANS